MFHTNIITKAVVLKGKNVHAVHEPQMKAGVCCMALSEVCMYIPVMSQAPLTNKGQDVFNKICSIDLSHGITGTN